MPKRSHIPQKKGSPDDFQTPPKAVIPLLPYLSKEWRIWECAAGKRNLVRALQGQGYHIYGSDILIGTDFLTSPPPHPFDCIVTNPPYSLKDEFVERCYSYHKPFALLMPLTALEGEHKQQLYREHGIQLIIPNQRLNFETPYGKDLGSWFTTAWFTWKLFLPRDLMFFDLKHAKNLEQLALL
jgi:hypothetical protein